MVQHIDGRGGVEGNARLLAASLDQLDGAVGMRPCFGMKGDDVGTRIGKSLHIGIDRRDHQVDIENFFGGFPQRGHDRRAESQVRNEMAVHHIQMDVIGPARVDRRDFSPQLGEIGT